MSPAHRAGVAGTIPVDSITSEGGTDAGPPPALDAGPESVDAVTPVPHALAGRVADTQLSRRTATSAAYSTLSRIVIQLLQFTSTIVLARLLTPNEFGLVAIVIAFTNFAQLFTDLGLGAAIVHRAKLREEDLASAFWLNVISGLALTALFIALAEPIADFYGRPALVSLLIVGSFAFTLSMSPVHLALLQRHLRFRAIGIIEASAIVVQVGVAIGCAAAGFGAMSLIIGTLAEVSFTTIAMWSTVRWWPRSFWRRAALAELWSYSGHLFGFNVVNYWSRNADNLAIGKFAGATALAYYARAYQFMMLPVQQVTLVVGRVLFPALVALQDDPKRMRDAYLQALRVMVAIAAPLSVGMATCATAFVEVAYGRRWAGVAPLLALLALSCPAQLISASTGALYQALGRTDRQFRRGLFTTGVTIAVIAVGVQWGAKGVAIGLLIKFYLLLPVATQGCWTLIGLRIRDGLRAVSFVAFASAVMGAGVVVAGYAVRSEPKLTVLGVQVLAGALVYGALLGIGGRSLLRDVRRAVRR